MRTPRWTLVVASVASLMVALDILAVSTALTTIRSQLGTSLAALEWTVAAYNLSLAVTLLPASALGDRLGRRRMFGAGLATFTAASAACALAPSAGWLITARAVQGAGAAFVLPLGLALVTEAYPPARRGRAMGIAGGITGLATVAGPVLGGGVTAALDWEWIFWMNVPIGLLTLVLLRSRVDESRGPDAPLDVPGQILVAFGVVGLVWGLSRAAWPAALIGLGLVAAFAVREWRLTPYFRLPGFATGNLATLLHGAIVLGPVFLMAQLFQTGLGMSPFQAGLRLLPWTATLLVVAPLAGALADRVGRRPVMVLGFATAAAMMAAFAGAVALGWSYPVLALILTAWGAGNSMIFPAVQSTVADAVPGAVIGRATGINQMTRELGGVLGIATVAAVFGHAGGYDTADHFVRGFAPAVLLCAALALAGMTVSVCAPGCRKTSWSGRSASRCPRCGRRARRREPFSP
jgi:EmrB/QacA subfamily drug resistance transporter